MPSLARQVEAMSSASPVTAAAAAQCIAPDPKAVGEAAIGVCVAWSGAAAPDDLEGWEWSRHEKVHMHLQAHLRDKVARP